MRVPQDGSAVVRGALDGHHDFGPRLRDREVQIRDALSYDH
ncbi:hypothetical protein [Streptomyces amritsarensis]|nr:hypothetical protein [Streptomyces amritsarensis]